MGVLDTYVHIQIFPLCWTTHHRDNSPNQSYRPQLQVQRPATVFKVQHEKDNAQYPIRATVMHLRDETKTEQVECKYLLGCDGAHSDIRQQLGIASEGQTTETHAGVIDALVRTNFDGRKKCLVGKTKKPEPTRPVTAF